MMSAFSRTAMMALLAASMAFPAARSALAIEPDDVPWDEIDRVLKEQPTDGADAPPTAAPDATTDGATDGQAAETTPRTTAGTPAGSTALPSAPANSADDPATDPADDPNAQPHATPAATPVNAAPAPAPPAAEPAQSAAAPATPTLPLPVKIVFETKAANLLRGADAADIAALSAFYEARQSDALWMTRQGYSDAAKDMIAEFARAGDFGLDARAFQIPPDPGAGASDETLAETDVRLSLAAMMYARFARGDRIVDPATQLSSYLDRKPNLIDRATLLAGLAAAPSKSAYLTSLHPKHPQFALLRTKLLELRAAPPEPAIFIPKGAKLTPGKSHPHIALVRTKLKVPPPGMKPDGTAADATYYDAALAGAVTRFKEKHGIEPADPTITAAVRTALNGAGAITEATLLANMEQWRWMPDDLGAAHIAVNIPEFTVRVIRDGRAVLTERVVTGQVTTQTPIFSDRLQTVVLQPPWIVPNSIKINELLPGLRAGRNTIGGRGLVAKRNGRTVDPWSVDWYASDIRHYDIQQPPGPSNVLGVVKFLFPNKHAVYLHDTPSKSLFNSTVRTFSHGCVRVRNPVRLAEAVLDIGKGWTAAHVGELLSSGPENNEVQLDKPLPVHLTYFTVWVDEAGELRSAPDVYGHEKRIRLALDGRWGEIDKGRDHLAPTELPKVARAGGDWFYDDPYAYGYYDPSARPRGGYRAIAPPKKKKTSVGSFINEIFGQ